MDWEKAPEYAVWGFVLLQSLVLIFALLKLNKKEDSKHLEKLTTIVSDTIKKQGESVEEMAVAVRQLAVFCEQDSRYRLDAFKELKRNQDSYHERLDRINEKSVPLILSKLNTIKDRTGMCPFREVDKREKDIS